MKTYGIIQSILDLYPDSTHVKFHSLTNNTDVEIWDFALHENFILASKDWDFHQLSLVRGFPPKVIYLNLGNCSTSEIIDV